MYDFGVSQHAVIYLYISLLNPNFRKLFARDQTSLVFIYVCMFYIRGLD